MKYKTIFFDLFFTLITPGYLKGTNENDVLGLSVEEWEKYAEADDLYYERAIGVERSAINIISKIVETIPMNVTTKQQEEILKLREARMYGALTNIDQTILDTLNRLKQQGTKLCLISNADVIDCHSWKDSPLADLFDQAIFSCDVGSLKPDKQIYLAGLDVMNSKPNESLFVGDGGSDELRGAKALGMHTVFTEYLIKKTEPKRNEILRFADHHITKFDELLIL